MVAYQVLSKSKNVTCCCIKGSQRNREPKQVMFSDGIRPGGDLTELDGSSEPKLPTRRSRSARKVERNLPTEGMNAHSFKTFTEKLYA